MENDYKNYPNQRMKLALLAGMIGMAWCADDEIQGPGNVVVSGKDNNIKGREKNENCSVITL